jgi:hypothetical protein
MESNDPGIKDRVRAWSRTVPGSILLCVVVAAGLGLITGGLAVGEWFFLNEVPGQARIDCDDDYTYYEDDDVEWFTSEAGQWCTRTATTDYVTPLHDWSWPLMFVGILVMAMITGALVAGGCILATAGAIGVWVDRSKN